MSKSIRIVTAAATAASLVLVIIAVAFCAVFPNKYSTAINAAADEFKLDRALVRSVVWTESKFDPRAVSSKGACGLMQMLPDTYEDCAKALGIRGGADGIFNVENSLRCGCYYLSVLIDKYGDTEHALMAYNAGPNNADKFIAGEPIFEETRKYVKNVEFAKRVYGIFC